MRSGQGVWINTGFSEDSVLQFAQQFGITDVALQSYDTSGIPNNGGKWEKYDLVKLRLKVENHGMKLTALENVPSSFYDHIMLNGPRRDEQIEI